MSRHTTTFNVLFTKVVTAQLKGFFTGGSPTGSEVAHRNAAELVDDIGHHRCTCFRKIVDDRLRLKHLVVLAYRAHDLLAVVEWGHFV